MEILEHICTNGYDKSPSQGETDCIETDRWQQDIHADIKHVRFEILKVVITKTIVKTIFLFWDITAYKPVRFNRRFGGTYHLFLHGWRVKEAKFFLGFSYTLKMVICSSETSVDFQRTARRYIPEGRIHYENFKSNTV
jgi:hypothetical protein